MERTENYWKPPEDRSKEISGIFGPIPNIFEHKAELIKEKKIKKHQEKFPNDKKKVVGII